MPKNKKSEKELKHRARRISIKEGIFAIVKSAFGDYYLSPFAIAINASNSLVAMLSSFSGLLGPISQMFSSRLIEKYPRKKIVTKFVFFDALMFLSFITIAILFYFGILKEILTFLFLFLFCIYVIILNISGPAWFSWMGDIVDEKYRGRWFAKRNLITGFTLVVLTISAAIFLDYFTKKDWLMQGFIILFFIALCGRLNSWRLFKKQYEPKIKLKKGYYFSFSEFLLKATKNNFGKFSIYKAFLSFATYVSSPLVIIYLLRHLEFNYKTYMIITFAGTLFSLMFLRIWGKLADKYGNYRILSITSILIPIIPILWVLHRSPIYLILVPSMISGIAWSGFNLCAGNFIYDNVNSQKRGVAISYYNMLNGIGIFLGAGLGAILIKYLEFSFIEPLIFIFILGGILRMIVVFIMIPTIKEIRKKEKFDSSRALKNLVLKEAKQSLIEETHEIISIKEYLKE